MPQPAFTRRDGLRAIGLALPVTLVAAACSADGGSAATASSAGPSQSAADLSARDESSLIAEYEAVLAAFPEAPAATAALLTSIRDQHAAHREALGGAPDETATATPEQIGSALDSLIRLEHEAARSRLVACSDATDSEQARLLALIAASEAAHVPALKDVQ
jgi:hypothetical protein